jgi:hypothetical protein
MGINKTFDFERHCDFQGCGSPALVLSEPPRCFEHIEDPNTWFSGLLSKRSDPDIDVEALRHAIRRSHDLYREALINSSTASKQLYKDYCNRLDPTGKTAFSVTDVAYFCIVAASSGITGNFAYDVIKTIVKSLLKKHNSKVIEEQFETVIQPKYYEKLRVENHPDGTTVTEVTRGIELTISSRFETLMWKELEND